MTTLRRLQGITYWVIEKPDEISDFINTNIRKEWGADLRGEGRDLGEDPWLQTLSRRRWRLEAVDADRIVLNPDIMNIMDPQKGYSFQVSLARRRKELRTVIETYGVVIWPVIVREEDMLLGDGYCRLTALREMGI
ncbi:MAG: hypothetical protein AABX62_00570, partial [Thermoproteota archaeon]